MESTSWLIPRAKRLRYASLGTMMGSYHWRPCEQNGFEDSMAGEGWLPPLGLESNLRTTLGSHGLDRIDGQSTEPSKPRKVLSARTVYVDSLACDCLVELYGFLDFLDVCERSGGKWQGEQVDAICCGSLDNPLYLGRILGRVCRPCRLRRGCTQNQGTAKEKSTKDR